MPSPEQPMIELRTFLDGVAKGPVNTDSVALTRVAISLIQTFPATRDAVMEYFGSVFDSSVEKYVEQIEMNVEASSQQLTASGQEDEMIADIQKVLVDFLHTMPQAWAPIISTWSLQLLGELSSRYAGRGRVSASAGLNETLQLWMSCLATRTLMDITTSCLSCLMSFDTEACISALLDTSVAHSPHFDWVVAHVGSCFPHTVITRVLSCGLRDFSSHRTAEKAVASSAKLGSVVGILGHLAGGHFADIRSALLDLFRASLIGSAGDEATVPYLLQLASLSPTLLRALTSDVLQTLSPDMLPSLSWQAPAWCRYLGGATELAALLVRLALGCEQGGEQIVRLLLDAASPPSHATEGEGNKTAPAEGGDDDPGMIVDDDTSDDLEIQLWSREILEMLLQEMDHMLRSSAASNVPLLECLGREVTAVQPLLLSQDQLRMQTAVRLVGLLGYHSPAMLISCSAYMLIHATTEEHLAALARLVTRRIHPPAAVQQDRSHKSHCLTQALEQAIRTVANPALNRLGKDLSPEQLWSNLATLLRWERESAACVALHGRPVSNALRANARDASALLSYRARPTLAHAVARAMDLMVPVGQMSAQLTLKLTRSVVDYFFLCIEETDHMVRLGGVNVACRLLTRVAQYKKAARAQALTELTQRALFGAEAVHFGARVAAPPRQEKDACLTEELHKMGAGNMLSHRINSTALTGSLSRHHRATAGNPLPGETVRHNTQLLLDAIKACATEEAQGEGNEPVISLDAITNLSLTLVQLISSDVMYNGLPWPDEEFCKVTVERDLHIRRIFSEQPLAWHLLRLVSVHRPCLCYCSVLLRALAATLVGQWGTAGQHDRDTLMRATQDLLEVMALGQLLPPPLASIRDVIPFLKAIEIVHLLRACVWAYMRDHVPSPALFVLDDTGRMWRDLSLPEAVPGRQYTEPLRFVMQANIAQLGTFYAEMFVQRGGSGGE